MTRLFDIPFGPVGCDNPCRFTPKETPREPAESVEQRQWREMCSGWAVANYDLAEDSELMNSLVPKIYEEMQAQVAEGASAENALANITAAIRRVRPRPTDELKYRADAEVARQLEERRRQGQGLGVRPR